MLIGIAQRRLSGLAKGFTAANLCAQLGGAYAVHNEGAEAGCADIRRCLLDWRRQPLPERRRRLLLRNMVDPSFDSTHHTCEVNTDLPR